MPNYIIKLDDYYLEWSTIVDAPISWGMKLEEFKKYYKEFYVLSDSNLEDRLKRVEEKGTSAFLGKLDDVIKNNRAGKNETCLTKEEIIEWYCIKKEESKVF